MSNPKPSGHRSAWTTRRVGTVVSILFGIFVLFDIALFGWLIWKSLSQREIEKILLETQEEAALLARQLEAEADKLGQEDLFVVVSVAEETKKYLGSVLVQRDIVQSIKIQNREGTVVFETSVPGHPAEETEAERHQSAEGGDWIPLGSDPELKIQGEFESEVAIGDLGSLVIGISNEELQRRIGNLRQDLVSQASLIGTLTVGLLGAAFGLMRVLFKRADRLERQAAEAERMAVIGTLASGLAHEIRNPLNSLNLNMQMLEEEACERDGGRSGEKLLSITRSEINRLENLVTDFLSYAKPRPLDLEEISALELFERVTQVLSGEIRAQGVEVRIASESSQEKVRVDRDQINQLLLNLTKNALAAAREIDRPGHIELRARPKGNRLSLEVSDNGKGVPETDRPKIFDLFFSTRKGGTGLGLAIVERIARSHGGEVEIDSIPGEGTTLRVLLPRVHTPG